jgi:hypothetical protein
MISNSNSLCRERDAQPSARVFYFTPCPVPSCPAYEPNSSDCEYSQPFRHIQYNRTASFLAMATLAILFSRRIIRCRYRRRQSGLHRAAACAASTSKKRSRAFPCLLICPSRCRPALESSHGIGTLGGKCNFANPQLSIYRGSRALHQCVAL